MHHSSVKNLPNGRTNRAILNMFNIARRPPDEAPTADSVSGDHSYWPSRQNRGKIGASDPNGKRAIERRSKMNWPTVFFNARSARNRAPSDFQTQTPRQISIFQGSMPKSSPSKCREFQDGNFKPLITKIHEERRYLDHFILCRGSSSGSFYSEVLGALHTYTTAKNRTIGTEYLTIHMRCKWKNRFVRGQDSNREPWSWISIIFHKKKNSSQCSGASKQARRVQ